MVKTQKRGSVISKAAIAQASSALEALPARPKSNWSLREAVSMLEDSITDALNKGYSYPEVSRMLSLKGVEISASSLKSYLSAAKRSGRAIAKGKKAVNKVAKKVAASGSKVVSLESKKAAPQPAKTQKSERQSKSKVVELKPIKTVAKAKSTATSRAAQKPASKASNASTRGRKKLG